MGVKKTKIKKKIFLTLADESELLLKMKNALFTSVSSFINFWNILISEFCLNIYKK